MNTLELYIGKVKYNLTAPSSWNELNEKQLLDWAAICLKKMSLNNCGRMALLAMYDIPVRPFFLIPDSQLIQLLPTIKFLFGANKLTKWVIPVIEHKGVKYHGPEQLLQNVSVGEWAKLELYYQVYTKQAKKEALEMLIATLYREARKGVLDKDIRVDLHELDARERALKLKDIAPKLQHAILLNYEGCRGLIQEAYLSKLQGDGDKGRKAVEIFDYRKVILSVAGGKFGTMAETENANLHDFMQHLVTNEEEIQRIRRKNSGV